MSDLPLVSVITPSFNQGLYIEETILSVLNQTYPQIEYLIIDGGSQDQTIEIIKKHEDRIAFWISEEDNGQADAINKGFKRAKGDFLCWINSDDILFPDFIEKRIRQFQENLNADFIYGDVYQGANPENIKLRVGRQTHFNEMLTSLLVPIPQQSAMWKKSVTDTLGGLEKKWHVLLDREYFLRIARYFNICYLPGPTAFFRNHIESKSIVDEIKWADEMPVLYEEILESNKYGLPPEVIQTIKTKLMVNVYLFSSDTYQTVNLELSRQFKKKAKKLNWLYANYQITKKAVLTLLIHLKKQILGIS